MKKLFLYSFVFTLVASLSFSSCKKETVENGFDLMTTYMVDNSMDLSNVLDGWITAAPTMETLQSFLDTYSILDIRSADDFAAGHIEGATNTTLGGILDAATGTSKPILVVCYTGQTAGHGTVALRLSGYADAKVLKWGMSGWNSNNAGPWAGNSGATNGNTADGHANWSMDAVTANATFDLPSVETESEDGATILEERVAAMLAAGFKGVTSTDVLAAPSNYFLNNFWAQADVDHYGHVAGAYRISPLGIANLNNLDASKPVVTYCWTGQTSSMVTAYLTVLGYDAKSLKFGTNGMIYSTLESHKFVTPTVDLPLVQ